MFTAKKEALIERKKSSGTTTTKKNLFIEHAKKKAAVTLSGNLAKKYSTTGNDFVDQFGKSSAYREPRDYATIAIDTSTLWAINPGLTVKFILFLRMITRVVSLFSGDKTTTVQRGSGLKHEGITRMIWLAVNHPDTFWKNIPLFISVGSWKDVIVMLSYDLQYNGWDNRMLDWSKFGQLILAGLENDKTTNLVRKYLPQIRSNSKCTTLNSQADNIIAKWICSLLYGEKKNPSYTYKQYRQLKTSGNAHQWQQLISQGKMLEIDFNTVHGRALSQLVSGKFLTNNKLEQKYEEWLVTKPIAKFTGYVAELFKKLDKPSAYTPVSLKSYEVNTINKQFAGLVEIAKKGAKKDTSMIVVRDTSGSMHGESLGTKMTNHGIAKALSLFFSEMLPDGAFANTWIEFADTAKLRTWNGSTPVEKYQNDNRSCIGGTNFQSVIDLFVSIKNKGTNEDEFPTGIICISDGEFNPADLGRTNVKTARNKLILAGFSPEYVKNFKIVLWNLASNYYGKDTGQKFETYGDVENVFYFSGYDGSIIAFLTSLEGNDNKSEPKTAEELFDAAMDQEVLNLSEV